MDHLAARILVSGVRDYGMDGQKHNSSLQNLKFFHSNHTKCLKKARRVHRNWKASEAKIGGKFKNSL